MNAKRGPLHLESIAKKLGVVEVEDWYKVSRTDFLSKGGILLQGQSLPHLLASYYPEHKWEIWKFRTLPKDLVGKIEKEPKEFVDWLGNELKIRKMSDWYRISSFQVESLVSGSIFKDVSLVEMLQKSFPDFPWEIGRFGSFKIKRSSQRSLAIVVEGLFPDSGIFLSFFPSK